MVIRNVCKLARMQDGAIWGKFLIRLHADGQCVVYDMDQIGNPQEALQAVSRFSLDKADLICPHCNAVVFGREYYAPGDEFPLLYSNIYNNYAWEADKMIATCCVYRIQREGTVFCSTLVQLIQVGFADDGDLWYSSQARTDLRPFGNFVVDRDAQILYAFTMRDATKSTRYFAFQLPRLQDGAFDEKYGVNRVILQKEDILDQVDCEYHHFLQGACLHNGKIYSVEGFTVGRQGPPARPALRVIDPKQHRQELCVLFEDYGLTIEPELIDFRDDTCYYGDGHGNLYEITF